MRLWRVIDGVGNRLGDVAAPTAETAIAATARRNAHRRGTYAVDCGPAKEGH